MPTDDQAPASADCPRCLKPTALCVCADINPIGNRVALLILQHPQEQDRALGTARVTALSFKNATLKIGLSWRAWRRRSAIAPIPSAGRCAISAPPSPPISRRTAR